MKRYLASNFLIGPLWKFVRNELAYRKHSKVAQYWEPIISDYFNGRIQKIPSTSKKVLPKKIIWQYWGQGLEDSKLPNIVKRCFQSVDMYKGDYQVIRLDDSNISDYLHIPEFIWNDNGQTKFPRVFFSDLLRLLLLYNYGGLWIDATVLLTDKISQKFETMEYFVFQRDSNVADKTYWETPFTHYWNWNPKFRVRMLSSFFYAKKNNPLISAMLDIMLNYWKNESRVVDYFFLQILYNELIFGRFVHQRCPVISDTTPHLLREIVEGRKPVSELGNVLKSTSVHKLTYFDNIHFKVFENLLESHHSFVGSADFIK